MISALFVEKGGVYFNDLRIDPWPVSRDARSYRGPNPVVAHPPCKRWGRYWHGGPSCRERLLKGDDGGCFASALWSVRTFGGVLEHPEGSAAWPWFGIPRPPKSGGWIPADEFGGVTCCVEQGHYGHPARKATWLYVVGTAPADLIWGPSENKARMDAGYRTAEERKASKPAPVSVDVLTLAPYEPSAERVGGTDLMATPPAFKAALVAIAEKCRA